MSRKSINEHKNKADNSKKLLVAIICILIAIIIALVVVFVILPAIKGKDDDPAGVQFGVTPKEDEPPAKTQEENPAQTQEVIPAKTQEEIDDWFDPSAVEGNLPGKTEEAIKADKEKIIEEGVFNISIASIIVFENNDDEGQARIENIAANTYDMSVAITLNDTGEKIYESGRLAPGQYIEKIKLSKAIPKGEHRATAAFTIYDKETLSVAGHATVKILIVMDS